MAQALSQIVSAIENPDVPTCLYPHFQFFKRVLFLTVATIFFGAHYG